MTATELVIPAGVERRDPRGATKPLAFSSPTMAQIPMWDAEQAFRLGYIANVIAYRCVQIRAGDSASVPLLVGRKYRDKRTVIDSHPLGRLLGPPPGGPAPKLSARKLLRWTFAQQIVTGRYAWEIDTGQGAHDPTKPPVALWPLAAAHLKAYESTGGTDWFRLFEYGPQPNPARLTPAQVFYGWDPSGNDFRQPESALQAARYDLTLATYADRYGIAFLRNNATPATVVTTDAFPDAARREAFQLQWQTAYGGPDNAGRTIFNEAGDGEGPVGETIDVKQLGLSQKDAQLAETRKVALQEVAIGLGVPWSKLDASGRTFDNAEAEDRTYWEQTVLADLLDFEDDLNMQIAPRYGDGVVCWFDLDAVRALKAAVKPVTAAVGAPSMVQSQLMTIDEGRADYGLPPLPDDTGARLMTAEEIQALKGSTDQQMREAILALEQRSGEGEGRETQEVVDDVPALPAPVENRGLTADEQEQRRARIWRTSDAVVTAMEGRWERAIRKMFARQARATVAQVEGKRGRRAHAEGRVAADDVFDRGHWLADTSEVVTDLLDGVVVAGFTRISSIFGVAFDVESEWAQAFIRNRANQLAGQVTDTTYEAIQSTLAEGVGAGESIPDLAARVRHVFDVADTQRATTIARTEVIGAFNGSAHLGATQLPSDVVGGQEWIATRDGRVRPEHAEADGQIVAMDAPFSVGGEALVYPGDPGGDPANVVNCRCTVAFLTPDEMTERVGEPREFRTRHDDVDLLFAVASMATPDTFDELAYRRIVRHHRTEVAA